jgi:hypothetical protein
MIAPATHRIIQPVEKLFCKAHQEEMREYLAELLCCISPSFGQWLPNASFGMMRGHADHCPDM